MADKLCLPRGQCLFNYNVINFKMQYIKPFAKLSLPLLFVFYSFSIKISFPSLFLSKTHQSAFNSNLLPPIRMQIRRLIFVVDFFSGVNTVAYVEFKFCGLNFTL